jgi:outer membrane protein
MKRILFVLIALLASVGVAQAQKVGYINTQTILGEMPEYLSAQQSLEKLSAQYQQYLEQEAAKIDAAYRAYQSDRSRLTESQRQARENDIISMEKRLQEKQKEYFGEGGVMASKSEQLLNPIRARVDNAIKKVAAKYGYSLVIDLSAVQGVVYNDGTLDVSMEVVGNL